MTEAQKDVIRADRLTMSAVEVALKHSITRQRVYQILAQKPDEAKRLLERDFGLDTYE